jgi:putative transposase
MPRRARLSRPGIPWHIIQRGNNRSVYFHAEDDYQFYLHYLKEFADKFDCALRAMCICLSGKRGLSPDQPISGNAFAESSSRSG